MMEEGGTWRPPAVNETCCARPQLAATLRRIADGGPDAVYTGQAGQVLPHAYVPPMPPPPSPRVSPNTYPGPCPHTDSDFCWFAPACCHVADYAERDPVTVYA